MLIDVYIRVVTFMGSRSISSTTAKFGIAFPSLSDPLVMPVSCSKKTRDLVLWFCQYHAHFLEITSVGVSDSGSTV